MTEEIGFGGSCHWCTEAIFLSLVGVTTVQQGWIADANQTKYFSEAVIVNFDPDIITVAELTAIHLHTHSCTSSHSMRVKYRSAVYCFSETQMQMVKVVMNALQLEFPKPLITEILKFGEFKLNKPEYLNYYFNDTEKPFCENIINPKLKELIKRFSANVEMEKLAHLNI
jgi:peptide-methionine (S)-S-oxide reductase